MYAPVACVQAKSIAHKQALRLARSVFICIENMDKTLKRVKTLQKQDLNAVAMYRYLAAKSKDDRMASLFTDLAAQEGRHAAACKKLIGKTLRPGSLMKVGIAFVRPFGKKFTLSTIARFERLGGRLYNKLSSSLPEFSAIASDELRHSDMLLALKEQL